VLSAFEFSQTDLEQMLSLELKGKQRKPVIHKLLGRLHTVERKMRLAEVQELLK